MTKEELAKLLNGRQYRNEINDLEEKQAKENNLVVIFGASDDLIEFSGAIYDEFDSYYETTILLNKDGTAVALEDEEIENNTITGIFTQKGWEFSTDIPHAKFIIYEGNEFYGEGLVINLDDLK